MLAISSPIIGAESNHNRNSETREGREGGRRVAIYYVISYLRLWSGAEADSIETRRVAGWAAPARKH